MHLLAKIISINTAHGVTTCGVSACGLKKEKGHIFYCNFKSCDDFFSQASAAGYFVLTFPETHSVRLPVCLFQLSGPEELTLSCVVQSAVKTHSMASHISSFWFCLSARLPPCCQCHKGRPGDNAHAWFSQKGIVAV